MGMRHVSWFAAIALVSFSVAGCCMPPRHCCIAPCVDDDDDLVPGPGGVRSQTLVIERIGVTGTSEVIGYVSTDPSNATWTWWLLTFGQAFPIELNAGEGIHFSAVLDGQGHYYGRMDGPTLCAKFKDRLTSPKYYKEVSSNTAGTNCP